MPEIGEVTNVLPLDEKLRHLEWKFRKVYRKRQNSETLIDNNGYGKTFSRNIDWSKQDRIRTGPPNHQPETPSPRGVVVAGAGREKNKGK